MAPGRAFAAGGARFGLPSGARPGQVEDPPEPESAMRRALSFVLAAALLAGCGGGSKPPARAQGAVAAAPSSAPLKVRHQPCDDGGSGGVMIDGVCL